MKRCYTDSDGGCFLFGNENFSFNLPNGYGDGRNTVLIFDSEEEFKNYCIKKYGNEGWYERFRWKTFIKGKFNLYNYDCCEMVKKNIKAKFDGSYSIYLRMVDFEYPTLAIVKRE